MTTTVEKPKLIIFDWDNTLVDTWPLIHEALNATLLEFDKDPWPIEVVRARVAQSMRDSFPVLFGDQSEKAGKRYQHHYRSRHTERLHPLEGAEDTLRAIREAEIPTVVISNKKGDTLREEVAHLGWDRYFSALVGADDAVRDKPHPDPVHLALDGLGIKPGPDVWFVGDSEIDLQTAANTGCTPVLYGALAAAHPEFTPTHYIGQAYNHFTADHPTLRKLLG